MKASSDVARITIESAKDERMTDSRLPGFYRLSIEQRRARTAELAGLDASDMAVLSGELGLNAEQADRMIENALGVLGVPVGLCAYLQLDGVDRLVLMAIEEPSVVAAASHAAKLLRAGGGVSSSVTEPLMVGQVQLLDVPDVAAACAAIDGARAELLALADSQHARLVRAGGGARAVKTVVLPPLDTDDPLGTMLVVHLTVDVREAMGANSINSMCETIAPRLEALSGGRARLRILSNLADQRTVTVRGAVPLAALEGKGCDCPRELAEGIVEASVFAERDPYRAATHNKGIMNGVDAVLLAFGQDFRAVEAGAHAYAARGGRYTALARWRFDGEVLRGELTMPMAVGVVGGIARVHPTVGVARRIAKIATAAELAAVTAAVGLAQNLGALRALAAEGIQRGHMRLHARNMAAEVGAVGREVQQVAEAIAAERMVNVDAARAALLRVRG